MQNVAWIQSHPRSRGSRFHRTRACRPGSRQRFRHHRVEGGERQLNRPRDTPDLSDPPFRERLIAGSSLPASRYVKAQRFRSGFRDQARHLFASWDILIALATACVARPIGTALAQLGGQTIPNRPNIGLIIQLISFIALPVANVPLTTASGLPLGVQIVPASLREALVLQAAVHLEQRGVV